MKGYHSEYQRQALEELRQLPPGSAVGGMLSDYSRLRDACRKIKTLK